MGIAINRKIGLYGAVVFALLLGALYSYLVLPLRQAKDEEEGRLASLDREYAALSKRAEETRGLPDAERIKLERLRREVPEQPNLESLVRDLRRLEVVSGARLKLYAFEPGASSAGAAAGGSGAEAADAGAAASAAEGAIPIRIDTSFDGNFNQIRRLFAEMESLDRLIQVERMSFSAKTGAAVRINDPAATIDSSLTLVAYYAPGLQPLLRNAAVLDYAQPGGHANPLN